MFRFISKTDDSDVEASEREEREEREELDELDDVVEREELNDIIERVEALESDVVEFNRVIRVPVGAMLPVFLLGVFLGRRWSIK